MAWKTIRGYRNVQEFIDASFDVSGFKVSDIPLPQGKIIVDVTGSSVTVWWDILEQCVCYNVEVCNA